MEISEGVAKKNLNDLADKGILFDFDQNETQAYMMAPTMAGFFEFALMRSDGKFDEKLLSELFCQYLNVEDGYIKEVFALDVPLFRIFVQENVIQEEDKTIVMDYEMVSKVIENSTFATVSTCFCRHKKEHLGEDCDAPKRTCMTFNDCARSLHKHGIAEKISKEEAYKIIDECVELGLVQLGDNIQNNVNWICNCCSCCCEGLDGYRRLGCDPKIETNFLSKHNDKECTGCGICVKRCPVDAIELEKKNDKKEAVVDPDRCIGCGVCANFCPTKTRIMVRRDETNFVPVDSFERYILNAIDEGKIQNYIFDNRDILSHELLRRFFKIFLALPPMKMALANKQLRSRFLNILAKTNREVSSDKDGKVLNYDHPEMKNKK